MTRDEDLELAEEAAHHRVLERLHTQHPSIVVAIEAIALSGYTVVGWAWWHDGFAFVHVERLHFIEAAYWREQTALLARNDHAGGAS